MSRGAGRCAVLLAMTLALAGCTGDAEESAKKSTAPAASVGSDAAAPAAGSTDPSILAGASSAASEAAGAGGACPAETADKAKAAITKAVGGPPMITKVEISPGCLEAKIATTLPEGGDPALKLCDTVATIAYPLGILGVSVTSADDKLLATGIRGDEACQLE